MNLSIKSFVAMEEGSVGEKFNLIFVSKTYIFTGFKISAHKKLTSCPKSVSLSIKSLNSSKTICSKKELQLWTEIEMKNANFDN